MNNKKVHFALQIVLKIHLTLILLLLLILFSNTVFTQTWPMSGAKWTYCLTGWNGMPAGEEIFSVTGDTVISGKIYSIISNENISTDNRKLVTRFSNDTVYRWVNNRDYKFFTFNLNVTDVFSTFRTAGWNNHWEDSACSSILPLKVIEESEIELEGLKYKQFVLKDTLFNDLYDPYYPDPVTYTLIERIGIINTYHFINTIEPPRECSLPTDWVLAKLGNYTDDGFEHLFEECHVGVNNKSSSEIHIFPNPAKNFVEIVKTANTSGKSKIQIINNLGIAIYTAEIWSDKHRIDLSNYEPGYYLLVLSPDNISKKKTSFPLIINH